MRKLFFNGKKGDYRFSDTALYLIVFLGIGLFIAWGMNIFYSYHLDIRGDEARILSDKLFAAVVINGEINEGVFSSDFNILKEAGLNGEVIKNGNFYFKVDIVGNNKEKVFVEGNRDFEVLCEVEGKKHPACYKKEISLGSYDVKILTASNQEGEKI